MTGRFTAHLESLPSVRAQIDAIVRAVQQRRNVIVLLQRDICTEAFADALRNALSFARVMVSEIGDGGGDLEALLTRTFPPTRGTARPGSRLAPALEQARDLVIVLQLGRVSGTGTPAGTVLDEWARLQKVDPELPVFCALINGASGMAHLPREDVHVKVVRTSTGPTLLEMRQLCRAEATADGTSLQAVWREHLGPALAGNDFRLLDVLWDRLEAPFEELHQLLVDYAAHREWSASTVQALRRQLPAGRGLRQGLINVDVPQALLAHWAEGLLQWSPEAGLEVHPAALTVSGGREQVRHRVWRAQVSLILPLIDHLRVSICRQMLDTKGLEWAILELPKDVDEAERLKSDSMTCQLGQLTHVLGKDRATRDVYGVARRMRDMRNDLAHYRLVTFDHLHDLHRHVSLSMQDWQDAIWA